MLELKVLLLDKPLSNNDAKLRRQVRKEIRVTHDKDEAIAVSERIFVMKNAEIAQSGMPRCLYRRPNSAFIADFIGDANLVDCRVLSVAGNTSSIRLKDQTASSPAADVEKRAAKLV